MTNGFLQGETMVAICSLVNQRVDCFKYAMPQINNELIRYLVMDHCWYRNTSNDVFCAIIELFTELSNVHSPLK